MIIIIVIIIINLFLVDQQKLQMNSKYIKLQI